MDEDQFAEKEMEYGETPFIPRILASEAIGMAFFRKLGLVELFDQELNKNRIVSPGRRAMLMVGTSCRLEKRERLYNIADHYSYAPLDRLIGAVPETALSGEAFGVFLDDLYEADASSLYYRAAGMVKAYLNIRSYVYNIDFSDTTILSTSTDHRSENVPDDAHFNKFGHSKEGKDDMVKINYGAVVNDTGLLEYLEYFDGNTADPTMMMDMIRFIERTMADERIVLVADCKMVNLNIIDRLEWNGFRFVSKCPDSFSNGVKGKVVALAAKNNSFEKVGSFSKKKDAPEFEACEFRMRLENGDTYRFIAYRRCDRPHTHSFLKRDGLKRWGECTAGMSRKKFISKEEADSAATEIIKTMSDTAYVVSVFVEMVEVPGKREKRGKPAKGDPIPAPIRFWKLQMSCSFDEERAKELSTTSDIRVIVTNLPESEEECEDIREGATMRQVMQTYFGQWKVEKVFGDMKSGVGADRLFVHNESRQESLLTILGISVLVRGTIQYVIRSKVPQLSKKIPTMTVQKIFRAMQNVNVYEMEIDGVAKVVLDGPSDEVMVVKLVAEALGLSPANLAGY